MPFFGLGGAETMCENLVYELVKMGHKVIVISLYTEETAITKRFEKAGIDIRYLDKKKGLDFSLFKKLREIFKQEKPDVIHTHIHVTKYVFPIAVQLKIRVVHTVHNVADKENGKLSRIVNKVFFKHCHVTPVALSELIRDTIVNEYGICKDNIPVIYNGIDILKCLPKENYSVNENMKILHIGRFYKQKNHIGLLEAFKLFHDKHSDSELWLIGDGDQKAKIEQYVNENNLESSVKFLGPQNNVYGYLHDADVFALPSNYEGIPLALIEAMGTGLPIVATAVGGVPDMLVNNESALLVNNDVESIANALEQYYLNANMRELHGQKAIERSLLFSATTMAKDYERVYTL